MANRDLSTFRRVTQQLPDGDGGLATVSAIADLGAAFIGQAQEAKINENLSEAQLDLNALDEQFRIEASGSPFDKALTEDYKKRRKAIFEQYGSGIAGQFKGEWNRRKNDLIHRSETSNQAWAFRQTRVNAVNSINTSMSNNFAAATANGRLYAEGAANDVETFLDFVPTRAALQDFAVKNLGPAQATEILGNYDADYVKSFLSGVAEKNPVTALQLMDAPTVKNVAEASPGFADFRKAIENKAVRFQKVAIEREVLGTLRQETEILRSGEPLSYADAKRLTANMSEAAQEYFFATNGFADDAREEARAAKKAAGNGATTKLDNTQKEQFKAAIFDGINRLARQDEVTSTDLKQAQEVIFKGMSTKALTRKEGTQLLTELVEPTLEGREETLDDFASGAWNPFAEDVGFLAIEDYFNDKVKVEGDEDDLGPVAKVLNVTNKSNLFDFYLEALRSEAARFVTAETPDGIRVGDIPKLGFSQRREIYKRAQDAAIANFNENSTPLALKNDIPINAIRHLVKNPDLASQFDDMFGKGAANRVLGR